MSCNDAMALISAKLDGALSPEEEQALAAHLAVCPDCRAWLDAMQAVDQKLAALAEPAPEGLKKGVLYRIDQATGKAKKPGRRWFGPGTALGAVAAVLVLLVGIGVIPLGKKTLAQDAAVPPAAASPAETQRPEWNAPEPLAPEQSFSPGAWENSYEYEAPLDDLTPSEAPIASRHSGEAPNAVKFPAEIQTSWDRSDFEPSIDVKTDSNDEKTGSKYTDKLSYAYCEKLSEAWNVMVLLYTDFDSESLFSLLREAEPALYDLTGSMQAVEENGLLRYETDCGTALAIQEWLVENLPPSVQIDPVRTAAEQRMKSRMEALDPGSSNLYRIISFSPGGGKIRWPESWPSNWADRLRSEENWYLFYPTEDYAPKSDAPAMLVFKAD